MAVRFDGATDHYTRSSGGFPASFPHTVAFWLLLDVDRNASWTAWGMRTTVPDYVYLYNATSDGTTLVADYNLTNVSLSLTGPSLTIGTWYFVATARAGNGSDQTLLATAAAGDASLAVVTGTISHAAFTPTEEIYGNNAFNTAGGWLNGRLENFMQWDAALTVAELEMVRRYKWPVRFANLYQWHPFWQGSNTGPALADWSGNGRTLTNGAASATADGPPIALWPNRQRSWKRTVAPVGELWTPPAKQYYQAVQHRAFY